MGQDRRRQCQPNEPMLQQRTVGESMQCTRRCSVVDCLTPRCRCFWLPADGCEGAAAAPRGRPNQFQKPQAMPRLSTVRLPAAACASGALPNPALAVCTEAYAQQRLRGQHASRQLIGCNRLSQPATVGICRARLCINASLIIMMVLAPGTAKPTGPGKPTDRGLVGHTTSLA
jgi:hypothetical protein